MSSFYDLLIGSDYRVVTGTQTSRVPWDFCDSTNTNICASFLLSRFVNIAAESALKSFLSGGVGGICVVLVGHPLDLIKVRSMYTNIA